MENFKISEFMLALDRVTKNTKRLIDIVLQKYGLRSTHASCFFRICEDEKGLSSTELSEACGVDKAFISRITSELVADGYIEVVDCICDIHHFYSSGIIVASSAWYDALSPEDQALIAECAQKAGEEQRAWFLGEDEKLISEYEAKGYTVTRPTDIDAWKAATAPVYDKMYGEHPEWEEMVNLIKAAAQ